MSTHYSSSHFTWKKDKLYLAEEFLIEVIPYPLYPKMFKLRWPDKTESKDFYNYSRARDNAVKAILLAYNGTEEDVWRAEEMDSA